MSRGHGASRRQAYGRRMKDLRTRRATQPDVDLDGPDGWNRGETWESDPAILPRPDAHADSSRRDAQQR
jgi:hypothetical protein